MNTLPAELLLEIASYCSKDDQLRLRLTSRALAETLVSLAFEQVHLCSFIFSFNRLVALSRSEYAKYVKSLTVWADGFVQTGREKANFMSHYITGGDYSISFTEVKTQFQRAHERAWDVYLGLCEESELAIYSNKQYRTALSTALSALPNLETLRVSLLPHEPSQQMKEYVDPAQLTVPSYQWIRYLFQCDITRRSFDLDHEVNAAVFQALGHRAMKPDTCHILRLEIETLLSDLVFEEKRLFPDEMPLTSFPDILQVMKHLEYLEVCLEHESEDITASHRQMEAIRSCCNPKELYLQGGDGAHPASDPLSQHAIISPLLGAVPPLWPRLETLRMSGNVLNKDMITFMHSRGTTLRSLSIVWSAFNKTEEILAEIPRALKLNHVHLSQLENWDDGHWFFWRTEISPNSSAENWLLGRSSRLPDWWNLEQGVSQNDETQRLAEQLES